MFFAAFFASAFAQNVLEVTGSCPDVTFTGTNFRPHSPVVVLHSAAEGDARITGGPCRGLRTGLASVAWLQFARVPASGEFTFDVSLPEPACDQLYQILDLGTCTVSDVVAIPPAVDPGGDTGALDTGL